MKTDGPTWQVPPLHGLRPASPDWWCSMLLTFAAVVAGIVWELLLLVLLPALLVIAGSIIVWSEAKQRVLRWTNK